jgi:hypothetical protein
MDKIEIKSSVTAKESPTLRAVKHKAVAGLSEADLIERHTIGELDTDEKNEKEQDEKE